MPTYLERCSGALVGLACGDAVGTTVEFMSRGSFAPVTDMVGGGPFRLAAGQWTDDTSMALCLAESLIAKGGFDATDQMRRYLNWWRRGYPSSTGDCFDIGMTVSAALERFEATGNPFSGSEDPSSAGNGALMRLAPVVLFFHPEHDEVERYAVESTRTTHAAPEALDCSRLLARVISRGLSGASKNEMLSQPGPRLASRKVQALATCSYFDKDEPQIQGTGYAVASLEAALWCFKNANTFEAAVLRAANLGDDADTTAAIVGQIAGAHYGAIAIPKRWRATLHMARDIHEMALNLGRSHGAA